MNIGGFTLSNRIWHDFTNEWIWDDMGLSKNATEDAPNDKLPCSIKMMMMMKTSGFGWFTRRLTAFRNASIMFSSVDTQIMECSRVKSGRLGVGEIFFFSYDWNVCCVCHKTWRKECRCFSPKSEHGDILEDVGNPKVNVGHENGNKRPELLMASSCTAVHDEIMMLGLCSYRLARFLDQVLHSPEQFLCFMMGSPSHLRKTTCFRPPINSRVWCVPSDNPWLVG